uniref:Major facilitator superfamily (MFS) profile domain-containing protein n=1 Tax=Leptobrachium leishanense TaxID=445787 RepID=A0A8C5LMW5_9ANUR
MHVESVHKVCIVHVEKYMFILLLHHLYNANSFHLLQRMPNLTNKITKNLKPETRGAEGPAQINFHKFFSFRKKTQLCNNLAALLGALLMAMSQTARSFEMIILGRLLYGINAGVSLNLHTMYIGECAPQKMRGMVTVSVSFFIAVGKLMGFLIGLREFMGSEELWPYLMSFSAIPALIQLATLPFFPDSPRYLLLDKSDKDGSLKAMQQLWGPGDHSTEIKEILKEKMTMEGQQIKGMKDLFVDHSVRWQLIMMGLICGGMQFIGINAVYFYAYNVFRSAGIPDSQTPYVALGIGLSDIFATLLCGSVIDCLGRKVLLWTNYGVLALTLALLTTTLSLQEHYVWFPYASCMFVFIFTLSFGLGPGSTGSLLLHFFLVLLFFHGCIYLLDVARDKK